MRATVEWNCLTLKEENQMADVITSQPESVAVAAAPAWATEIRKYVVEAIGAFFLTFVVVMSVLSHSVLPRWRRARP
jgi:hypothetical protein